MIIVLEIIVNVQLSIFRHKSYYSFVNNLWHTLITNHNVVFYVKLMNDSILNNTLNEIEDNIISR